MMLADRYRLDALLGRGGMGEVWRAWDLRLGRPVAVKLLAGFRAGAADAVSRFQHEARIAARLSHPHVVAVYDVGIAEGRCFLVMELVVGPSLAQELREEGPLALSRVAQVAAQTAAGLAAAHRRGVVHRDIKPSNVLVGEDDSVKIADFGIATGDRGETTAAAATQPDVVLGTSLYLSPEAAMGGCAGQAADVYGLGCSLYELLTGQPPFPGEHPIAVLRRHVEDTPVPPRLLRPDTPSELDAYLLRMLVKQPELRPTAEEAAAWFEQADWQDAPTHGPHIPAGAAPDAVPGPAASTLPPAVPRQGSARRRAPVAGAVTAAAAIAAATFLLAPPIADGTALPHPSHSASRHDSGTTAPPGAAPAAADASGPSGPPTEAPGTTSSKGPAGTTLTSPASAMSSSGATTAVPARRSAPVFVRPTPTTTPPTTTPQATPSHTTGATTDPTPTTSPPTPTDTTPSADSLQGP